MLRKQRSSGRRRGAVTVEFALVAPVFLTMMLGVSEASRLYEVKNLLSVAAREGARVAAMDRAGLTVGGQSTNAKVAQDVKNFLKASGLDPEDINVQIVSHADPSKTFNLDDPANDLKYFEVRVTIPYNDISSFSPPGMDDYKLQGKIVFRNAKAQAAN